MGGGALEAGQRRLWQSFSERFGSLHVNRVVIKTAVQSKCKCSAGADVHAKCADLCSGALERRHSAALEPLAQRSDALGGPHLFSLLEVIVGTNGVLREAASQGERS